MHFNFESKINVEKISLRGPGVVILTGPSSCGKGEVANVLSKVLSISSSAHISMGEILRTTAVRARTDESYSRLLEEKYSLSQKENIFACQDTTEELTKKVISNLPALENYFKKTGMDKFTSQLEWLEFCTMNGLLVPNRWTQNFIAAYIEHNPAFRTHPFILDGYPRTVTAAQHLLDFLYRLDIPIIKVLHLSISKQEMLTRATKRARPDDDVESLLSRYQFYIESVQPSVDYMKMELGSDAIALIDAHQPVYVDRDGKKTFDLQKSIANVAASALRALGASRITINDLLSDFYN